MAKVLFIGDMHLKINRFEAAKQFLKWTNQTIKDHKPDLIVNLGDTFDTHAIVRSEIMHEFMIHVEEAITVAPYVYVVGNHCCYKPNDIKYHALSHVKNKVKDFYIVDSVQNLFDITFVPYIHNPLQFPSQTLPICVAHQTFKGADYGNITTKDGVDASTVKGAELIVSGHIHKRQKLVATETTPEVFYPGSPFSQGVSDINQVKGVSIIETDTLKELFIPCPMPMWKGLSLTVDASFSISDVHSTLLANINSNDHWVLEISGPKAEIVAYLGSKVYKEAASQYSIKVKPTFTDKDKKQVKIEAISMEHIVSEFIDKIYSGNLDKTALKSKAVEIIAESRKL